MTWVFNTFNASKGLVFIKSRAFARNAAVSGGGFIFGGYALLIQITHNVSSYNASNNTWKESTPFPDRPRWKKEAPLLSADATVGLTGYTTSTRAKGIAHWGFRNKVWKRLAFQLVAPGPGVARNAAAPLDSNSYLVVGAGSPRKDPVYVSQWYNVKKDKWKNQRPWYLGLPRWWVTASGFNRKVYFYSGWYRTRRGGDPLVTNALSIYDHKDNSWIIGPSMPFSPPPVGISMGAGGALDDKAFYCGGTDRFLNVSKFAVQFNPEAHTWEVLAPMPYFRVHHRTFTLGKKIYVTGGQSTENDFTGPHAEVPGGMGMNGNTWEYNPKTNTWKIKAFHPIPRTHHGAFTI